MPAFNAEITIEESILSILNQTYQNWELIIVDDGSTDKTNEISSKYAASDKRIKLIQLEANAGIVAARNRGVEKSQGKYIANLDSDDLSKKDRLSLQVAFMENNKDYVLLGSACDVIDEKGKLIQHIKRDIPSTHLKSLLLFSNYFINSSVIMIAKEVKNITYSTDIQLAEDYCLFTKLAAIGKVGNLKSSLVEYRSHNQNISKQKKEELKHAEKNVQLIQLNSLGISPSKEELEIHNSLVDGPYSANLNKINLVEQWLLMLIEANNEKLVYDFKVFNYYCAYFFERYCQKSGIGIKALKALNRSSLSHYLPNRMVVNIKFIAKLINSKANQ